MVAKTYLILISVTYLVLAIWCTVSPTTTSRKVGFELNSGSGQSEFMTVYGGLEFGIAVIFAAACFQNVTVNYCVWASVLLHGSVALFRAFSLLRFEDIGPFTYRLAVGEWLIAILGILTLVFAPLES